jgi:hypothetical protein
VKRLWARLFGRAPGRRRRERSPRIRLLLSDAVRLETDDGVFPVVNLSDSGIGLLVEGEFSGKSLRGTLYLGSENLELDLEVARTHDGFIGARFRGDSAGVRSALRRHFQEEIHATEMSEVDSSHLANEGKGKPRWFYAPGNYELFFLETEDGRVTGLQMEWSGRVLALAENGELRAGFVHKEERTQPGHARSSLIHWESEVTDMDRAKAIRVLENIPGLDPAQRGMLVGMVRG